jgi:D-cysteine desulfhydrase
VGSSSGCAVDDINFKLSLTTLNVMESFATPVERNVRLSEHLGCDLRIKRDDSYPAYGGGNKARKIRYIVEGAVNAGYDAIVTNGGVQSNHARATALICAEKKIKCSLILHSEHAAKPSLCGNLLLMNLAGVSPLFCKLSDLSDSMNAEMASLQDQGFNPLYLWGGGHCVEGAFAYYEAAKEAQDQCDGWIPDYVVHASGTGTTQAGLIAGYADVSTKVVGVSVAREKVRGSSVIQASLAELGNYLKADFSAEQIDFRDDWIEGGYEQETGRLLHCIDVNARMGLILDPTYTGKAFLGLEKLLEVGEVPRGSKVLFWHTGGLLNLLSSPTYTDQTL